MKIGDAVRWNVPGGHFLGVVLHVARNKAYVVFTSAGSWLPFETLSPAADHEFDPAELARLRAFIEEMKPDRLQADRARAAERWRQQRAIAAQPSKR